MRHSWRKTAFLVLACALFAAILISLLRPADVKLLNLSDKSVRFKFATITRGGNHVMFIGNSVVARLKWGLDQSRFFGPLAQWIPKNINADWVVAHTDVKDVLWVGFECPHPRFLHTYITNSVGHNVDLPIVGSFQSSSGLTGPLSLQAFELPTTPDKLKGYTVRVYSLGTLHQENELATLQVR
jgi:hypothetical protein